MKLDFKIPCIGHDAFRATGLWCLAALLLGACASPPPPKDLGPIAFPKSPEPTRFYFERTLPCTGSDIDRYSPGATPHCFLNCR